MKICYQFVLLNRSGKKKANSTGGGNLEWIWYSQMEEILSQSKAINPDYIADSSTPDSPNISDNENPNDKENYELTKHEKRNEKQLELKVDCSNRRIKR